MTNNLSEQAEKSLQTGTGQVFGGDYPSAINIRIATLRKEIAFRRIVCSKFGLHYGSYDVLVLMIDRWLNDHIGSTVYSLAAYPKNSTMTAMMALVSGLLRKGLIEVSGTGRTNGRNGRIYIPSSLVMAEFELQAMTA